MYELSSFLLIPNGSRVVPLLMKYASLAYHTLSLSEILVIKKNIYIYIFPIVKSALLILFNIISRERERERRLGTRQVCQNGLVNFVATHDET